MDSRKSIDLKRFIRCNDSSWLERFSKHHARVVFQNSNISYSMRNAAEVCWETLGPIGAFLDYMDGTHQCTVPSTLSALSGR